ncbi:MAG: sensor histidine kinase [Pseudomonadota bacterium]|nr:sensor histidine kinase [Pseudomonadota bacterium]
MSDDPINPPLSEIRDQYQRLLQRLEANEREFRRLGRSVLRVQEDERRRLARELHDGIGQNLTALQHRLDRISAGLGDQPDLRGHLDAAAKLCRGALDDTRQMSRLLRPPILDDLGLVPALQWLARSLGEASGLSIDTDIEPLPTLPDELQTLVFRVAQEALNNAAKHAQAGKVLLRLVARAGMLQLQIVDDGCGCDPEFALKAGGSGLGGMRERLRLHGGRLELHSSPGNGARVRAVVPLDVD